MDDLSPREKFLRTAVQKGYMTLDGLLRLIDDFAAMEPAAGPDRFMATNSSRGENRMEAPPGRTAN